MGDQLLVIGIGIGSDAGDALFASGLEQPEPDVVLRVEPMLAGDGKRVAALLARDGKRVEQEG